MLASFMRWFEPSAFSPHGFCLLWEPGLIWVHALSDAAIMLAYFSIPLAIAAFVRQRLDMEHRWVAWLFAAFILACGATHLLSVITLWQPLYWLEGGVKIVTAVVSVATAIALWPLLPKLLALPSPSALREANVALEGRIAERNQLVAALEQREVELTELTAGLETRIAERTASLDAAKRRFETALAASGVTVFTQDDLLAYTYISKGEFGLTAEQFIGRMDADVMPDAPQEELQALKRRVLETGEAERGEFDLHGQWFQLTAERLPAGAGIICGAIDITQSKQDEARIRFLLNEMAHRVGNLLAVAQGMLRQTVSGCTTVEEVAERLGARFRALATSQCLLLRSGEESGATLSEVVEAQMAAYSDNGSRGITMSGPHVELDTTGIMHIGMALHELATNASKYGALSVSGGSVEIAWGIDGADAHLRWREKDGPAVTPPDRRGFGREVIEWAVERAVQGRVLLEFRPEGLFWELRFPLQA